MNKFSVTNDTSGLTTTEGFWSGRKILVNTNVDQLVVLAADLTASEIIRLIGDALVRELPQALMRWLEANESGLSARDFDQIMTSKSSLKSTFGIRKSSAIQGLPEFGGKQVTWDSLYEWLKAKFPNQEDQKTELVRLLTLSILENPGFVTSAAPGSYAFQLMNDDLQETLHRWSQKSTGAQDMISSLLEVSTTSENLSRLPVNGRKLLSKRWNEIGMAIPKSNDVHSRLKCLMLSSRILIGLLRVEGKVLLAPNMLGLRWVSCFSAPKKFYDSVLSREEAKQGDRRSLVATVYCATTIESIEDVPADIRNLLDAYPYISNLSSCFRGALLTRSQVSDEDPFPISSLNRLLADPEAIDRYTTRWLEEHPDVSEEWARFSAMLDNCSSNGVSTRASQLRNLIDWALFSRGIAKPGEINIADLRDAHNPNRKDTFYSFIESKEVTQSWGIWQQTSLAFKRVFNYCKLDDENALLETNPFDAFENPFRSSQNSSAGKTRRLRIPNNHHEAMMQVLLSPDEDGKPTYSFIKDELKWFWFDWYNPQTGLNEKVWCPSAARCLAFMMIMVPRGKQARWLDQGLMDEMIWDVSSASYVENTHELRSWRHPKTGQSHLDTYGRPSGVIQPIQDDYSSGGSHCVFVNTNKTAMWDPHNKTGHEIWWPRSTELKDTDIAVKLDQAAIIDRPYLLIEEQLKWLEKYDPSPEPITFSDIPEDRKAINEKEEYPYFTPIFRDLASARNRPADNEIIFPPVAKNKLERCFHAIAYEAERRLLAQGSDATLTLEGNGNPGFRGRKCIYDLHSLRVWGLSYLLEIGVPLTVAQMIMGHEAPSMTLHYNKQSSAFVRSMLAGRLSDADLFGDWDDGVASDFSGSKRFLIANPGVSRDHIPHLMIDQDDYAGYTNCPGGVCLVGGTGCGIGEVNEEHAQSGRKHKVAYQPVSGGCGNCRFFATNPAKLVENQMIVNELMIRIRSLGKKQTATAQIISEAQWTSDHDRKSAARAEQYQNQLSDLERQTEPLIREWMNRVNMIKTMIESLDDYKKWQDGLKNSEDDDGAVILFSSSNYGEVSEEIEFRMEKTGEFELARQALLAAHLHGGIEQASELTRLQVREFIDRIMKHDDTGHLLLKISCAKTRDKVAFLCAEALAVGVGSEKVQDALDKDLGLKDMDASHSKLNELSKLMGGIFDNVQRDGGDVSLEHLLSASAALIETSEDAA